MIVLLVGICFRSSVFLGMMALIELLGDDGKPVDKIYFFNMLFTIITNSFRIGHEEETNYLSCRSPQ